MPVKEYINREVKPYQPCSNSAVMEDLCIKGLLRGPAGEQYVVKFRKPGGELITLNLTHARTEERETWPAVNRPGLLEFKWLEGKVAYVQLNSFANPKIDSMFVALLPQLYECKGLILDLRNNGGGSSLVGREIFQYLTRDTLLYGSQSFTRQHIALFKAYGAMLRPADTLHGIPARGMSKEDALTYYRAFNDQLGYPLEYSPDTIRLQARRLVVPTVILIGHNTASAAEEFLIYADDQPHMTLIGQPTFGSTGQPYEFSLPGGGKARVCTKKNTYPDGREYVGTGILPDIYTDFTLDDLLKQQDPALKRALLFLAGK
jgi:C-terminal processing protease CtpA/Prc